MARDIYGDRGGLLDLNTDTLYKDNLDQDHGVRCREFGTVV